MKFITKIAIPAFVLLLIISIISCNPTKINSDIDDSDNLIVLVQYKAQPQKGEVAVNQLKRLIEVVKQEPHFINIKLHVDPSDDTNILLYEEWGDRSYYNNGHMSTAHLKEFIENSRNFLAGSPEISQWRVERSYE